MPLAGDTNGAVDDAVVATDRQVHQLRPPHAVAVIIDEHRALDDAVGADDRHFGAVDHRGGGDAAERAERGDRQPRARQFLALRGAVARGFGVRGVSARTLDEVAAGVDEFLKGDGPMVMDMRISRNVLNITYRRMLYGEDA